MNMKSNELMIGDYARYNGKTVKVTILSDNVSKIQDIKEDIVVDDTNDIKPLELTNERLSKTIDQNPARLANGNNEWQIFASYLTSEGTPDEDAPAYSVIIDEKGNGWYETTIINHDTNNRFDGNIRYVHELQHALKLLEVDVEIKLED